MITSRAQLSRDNLSDAHTIWEDVIAAYRNEADIVSQEGVAKTKYKMNVPLMYNHCEVTVAMNTVLMLRQDANFIKVVDPITGKREYQIENLLYNFFIDGSYGMELAKVFKMMFNCGVGFVKIIPDYDLGIPKPIGLNGFNLLVDPYLTSLDTKGCQYVVHEYWMTLGEILDRVAYGKFNQDEVSRMVKEKKWEAKTPLEEIAPSFVYSNESRGDLRDIVDSTSERFARVKVQEYWDRHVVAFVLDELYLVSFATNAFGGYPFYAFFDSPPLPEEFFMKGKGEILIPTAREIDVKRSQRLDNVNKALEPPVLYTIGAIADPSKLKWAAGNKIAVLSIDGIKEFVPNDVTSNLAIEEGMLKADAEDITGVGNAVKGQAVKKERLVADEASSIYSSSVMRFEFANTVATLSGLVPMLKGVLNMALQMGVPNIAGNEPNGRGEPMPVEPDALVKKYRISLQINPNKAAVDAQNALTMYQILSPNPNINQQVLMKFMVERMFPDYPEELFTIPQGQQVPTSSSQGIDNNLSVE